MRPERPPFVFYLLVLGIAAVVFVLARPAPVTTDDAPPPTHGVVEVPRNLRLRLRLIHAAKGGAPSIDPEIDAKILDVMRPLKFDRMRELADETLAFGDDGRAHLDAADLSLDVFLIGSDASRLYFKIWVHRDGEPRKDVSVNVSDGGLVIPVLHFDDGDLFLAFLASRD